MITIDPFTITLVTALVVVVSGIFYLVETLLRKEGAAGRLWAIAFLSGILSIMCYLVWAFDAGAFVAVALGNGAFVATAAFLWLGCRAYNGRDLRVSGAVVGIGVAVVVIVALLAGPDGGDWAGAVAMFLGNAVFAAIGAAETRRGALATHWSAIGLTVVLSIEAVWFTARTGVFLSAGSESELFQTWFGTIASSLLTITLTIATVVTTSVLRAGESNLRGQRDTVALHVGLDGILLRESFRSLTTTILDSARRNEETMCIIAVRLDDLDRIATAFGPGEAEAVAGAWRAGVRGHAPTAAIVGEGGRTTLLAAFLTTSFADVRRTASIIHRRILDDMAELGLSVLPVVSVGVALTDQVGYDFDALADAAEDAAKRSASSHDASVILAQG
jgi:GGDEF domain-containing protein